MPPPGIIEALDVIEHVGFGLVSRAVRFVHRALGLQRGEETLHCGIVPDIAGSAHAASDAVVSQEALERLTRILTPSIGVMQDGRRRAASPDRHHEGIGDQLRGHRRVHRPADDPTREEIHHRRHVEPPFGGPEIGEVGDPFAVGRRGGERSVEHIRRDGVRRPDPGVRWQPPPSGPGAERRLSHEPLDPMSAAGDPLCQQVVPDAPGPVGAVAGQEAGSHSRQQLAVGPRPGTRRPGPPGIKACARNPERLAQPFRRPDSSVCRDEGEFHSASFAK